MTYGERLQQQGIQQGMQQGIEAVAKSMLDRGYDPSEVKALTKISQEVMSKVNPGK